MPGGDIDLDRAYPVGSDTIVNETGTKVNPSTTGNIILSFRTPTGCRGKITDYRQAFDAGLNTFLSHYLRINGVIVWPVQPVGQSNNSFTGSKVQIASPEQDTALARPIPFEQNSLIEMLVDVAAGGTAGNVTGVIVVKYYEMER